MWSASQVEAWRPVTRAIHAKGCRVFVQLWHVGRMSHPSLQPDVAVPVAPSAILPKGSIFAESGYQPCIMPRALEPWEIADIIAQYARAGGCYSAVAGSIMVVTAEILLAGKPPSSACRRTSDSSAA